ncbi:plasmid stabilization system protein ParE [Luteibacter rhizovicinus]|uniref:Plasmid stabilization system protein ParE n=1 Tax=Luteibacter rhizovicinus TaxID=242606 RepID=A0A4R3YMQ6_9GAMM|nr:type II toxin-antitoxin system RelE/ParE family toxin [Luteibacter rhizovicinus]TCV92778.1 plasmid stabilization system protein ParE [Luteibacter rhizovicinus]
MSFDVRYTRTAREDLVRLYRLLLEHDREVAARSLDAIRKSADVLADFPFTCRKADPNNPFVRELVVPFGIAGYVALFEIEDDRTVTILAVRHQREDDFH